MFGHVVRRGRVAVAALASLLLVTGAVAVARTALVSSSGSEQHQAAPGPTNVERFAQLSFGDEGGGKALAAQATPASEETPTTAAPDASIPQPGSRDRCTADEPLTDVPPIVVTRYRTPNGWCLRPAGTQIDTPRAPTGVTVSPDGKTVYVVNSGIFDEQLEIIDAGTYTRNLVGATDLYMGVGLDGQGNVWASGGNRNKVFQFKVAGPTAVPTRHVGLAPGEPTNGLPAVGYPGNLVAGAGRLFVAGNLSVPLEDVTGGAQSCGAGRSICSVLEVWDLSAVADGVSSPAPRLVPVGRDAYAVALNENAGKLYVTNWADETEDSSASSHAAGTGTVSIVDIATPGEEQETTVIPVGHHPTGMALSPDHRTLVVTNSADDTISTIALDPSTGEVAVDPTTGQQEITTESMKPVGNARRGATPLAVSFSPDGQYLYVALAGENAVEVRHADGSAIPQHDVMVEGADIGTVPHTYIPTAWYPSALASAVNPAGGDAPSRLYVTNLKGIGAGPGLNGQASPVSGVRTEGTVSAIDVDPDNFNGWTASVIENNNWRTLFDQKSNDAASDPCKPAPLPDGGTTFSQVLCDTWANRHGAGGGGAADRSQALDPHQLHVVYVVKENKTFDQYFGDVKALGLPGADADPTWLLYGEPVTTNQHRLARDFTLSDRFWADSEQSTTGHSWTSAGYATEYNEISWNTEYDQGLRGARWNGQYDGQVSGPSDSEVADQEGELFRPQTRLADAVKKAGYSVRVYSDDLNPDSPARSDQIPLDYWGLKQSSVNHGRDLDFPDTDRADIFLHGQTVSNSWSIDNGQPPETFGKTISLSSADKAKFTLDAWEQQHAQCIADGKSDAECQGTMPNFLYVALPVDHTLGFNPMDPTPASMVANNDYALGKIVDALSKSPFWKNTLVFVLEDDTQFAGDHVDSHRTFLLTAGGLARTDGQQGQASHQEGSFPSVLKTIEVLFDVKPQSLYDAGAVPLHDVIVDQLDQRNHVNYDAVRPPTPFLRNQDTDVSSLVQQISSQLDWRLDHVDPVVMRYLFYAGIRGWPLPAWVRDLARKPNG